MYLFLECKSFALFNGEGKMSSTIENFNLVVHLAVKHSALDSLIPVDQIQPVLISPKKRKKQVTVARNTKKLASMKLPLKISTKLASKVGVKKVGIHAECKLCHILINSKNLARHKRMCEIKFAQKARATKKVKNNIK